MTNQCKTTSKLQAVQPRPRAMRSLLCHARQESGSTLIEMMIVITIMSILMVGFLGFINGFFNTTVQAQEMFSQRTDISTVSDYIGSKIDSSGISDIGLISGGVVSPVSYAGDQLVFKTSTGACYRLFYVARLEQLRAAESTAGCSSITPKRGPNQIVNGSYAVSDPNNPLYDPVLDNLSSASFVLASNVATGADGSTSLGVLNQPITYKGPMGSVYSTDSQANSASTNSWYADHLQADDTESITVKFYVGSPGSGSISVRPVVFTQDFYLNH